MTQVYAALAHVHITQGRVVRLCVTRAVHLVLHPGFVRISGKPRYAGYVWGRNPSALFLGLGYTADTLGRPSATPW
jgi:hypothetical protein